MRFSAGCLGLTPASLLVLLKLRQPVLMSHLCCMFHTLGFAFFRENVLWPFVKGGFGNKSCLFVLCGYLFYPVAEGYLG